MQTIAAFGDSILKGVLNTDGHFSISKSSFVHLCEPALDIQVINKAKMGSTITEGRKILERHRENITESTGRFTVLEFGGNDCDHDWTAISNSPGEPAGPYTDLNIFKEIYLSLIDSVRQLGKEPLLLSLPPIESHNYFNWITRNLNSDAVLDFLGGDVHYLGDWHEMYNLEVFKIAQQTGSRIIDITSCFLKTRNYGKLLCMDGIHPNEEGHALIARTVCEYFS